MNIIDASARMGRIDGCARLLQLPEFKSYVSCKIIKPTYTFYNFVKYSCKIHTPHTLHHKNNF